MSDKYMPTETAVAAVELHHRVLTQYSLRNDWLPVRGDMIEHAIEWGFDIRQREDGIYEMRWAE